MISGACSGELRRENGTPGWDLVLEQVQPSNEEFCPIFQEDGSPRRLRVDDPSAIAKAVLTLLGLLFWSTVYSPYPS